MGNPIQFFFLQSHQVTSVSHHIALEAEIEKWEAIKEQRLAAQAWIDAEVKKILAKKEKEGKKDDE
ncbi:hypothetical protein HYE67_004856 [Fusarium culmorum]|uniref:Uncharacterized protein n=1 Tax=Fusarium culmorum TaxID=5516 RepID=A0A7S8D6E2_FUSCU|nr:hypothetical protein HYE67_004856 [Fusarium culmorum]